MLKERYLTQYLLKDLNDKMVFVGGPRQVGKTTIAREFVAKKYAGHGYYNWDNQKDRPAIPEGDSP
jgi:hypothetical protein